MFYSKVKVVAVAIAAVGLLGTGIGFLVHRAPAEDEKAGAGFEQRAPSVKGTETASYTYGTPSNGVTYGIAAPGQGAGSGAAGQGAGLEQEPGGQAAPSGAAGQGAGSGAAGQGYGTAAPGKGAGSYSFFAARTNTNASGAGTARGQAGR